MKETIVVSVIITYILVCVEANNCSQHGKEPLFLTPLIEKGKIKEAKQKAFVQHPQFKDVKSYAGYLTINKLYNSNTFFWHFPSKRNPQTDPLLLWLNGGPGSTSLIGLFGENGPFIVTKNSTIEMRKYSWIVNHNIIYIDNPVGAGYSFTDNPLGYITLFEQTGDYLLAALIQFFKLFPEVRKNDFYVTGESYAGKYIPALCHAIKIHNQKAALKINLKGLAIGNGATDPINQFTYYSDRLFEIGLIDTHGRDQFKHSEDKIRKFIAGGKREETLVEFVTLLFQSHSSEPSIFKNRTGYDFPYNFYQTERPEELDRYTTWITKSDVRQAIHVGNCDFHSVSQIVQDFMVMDILRSAAYLVEKLIEDYKILIYHGQPDILISYTGTERFIKSLNWTGAEDFKIDDRKIWRVGHEIAGYSKVAKNLNFLLVRNSGHYTPYYQPLWALDMITRFTHNLEF